VALETGGGIFRALEWLGPEPFIVINGDVWTDFDVAKLSLPAGSHGHIVLVRNPPHHPGGDFGLKLGRVIEDANERYTFSGLAVYRGEFFAECRSGRFPLLPLLKRAIAAGTLSGELHEGRWYDIGTPQRLAALDRELKESVPAPR
jgi:MurNAc alpha-1-phosphate uridylyltransferase